eukprot:IDg19460t1
MAIATKGGQQGNDMSIENTVLTMLRDRRHAVISNSAPKTSDISSDTQTSQTGSDVDIGTPLLESATCCHPVRDDEVMGIRSVNMHGRTSVIVHRLHCEHLLRELRMRPVSSRVVGLRWAERLPTALKSTGSSSKAPRSGGSAGGMTVRVVVVARDCVGLLSYITGVLSRMGHSIERSSTVTDKVTCEATLAFEVLVNDVVQ